MPVDRDEIAALAVWAAFEALGQGRADGGEGGGVMEIVTTDRNMGWALALETPPQRRTADLRRSLHDYEARAA
jgi:hypothetical protein